MAIALEGELTLPTNPNCVSFAAAARDVLASRSWVDVQRMASRALEPFYRASGIPATALFSFRTSRDRKNRQVPQVTMLFAFDGPATAAHLEILENVASASPVLWGRSSIERIPTNALPSLMYTADGLFQLWSLTSEGYYQGSLVLGNQGVEVRYAQPAEGLATDFLPAIRHAACRRPRRDEHDEALERMRLVFALCYAQRIIEADGKILDEEVEFMDAVFPEILLRRMGLHEEASVTEWMAKAIATLPGVLGHHDKLAMVGLFFSACYSDGTLDAREMRVLKEAGETLGLTKEQVVSYLQRFW